MHDEARNKRCPCRKKSEATTYAECCEPYHRGLRRAPTAQALMRSRYAAHALSNAPYLRATWHPRTRPKDVAFVPGRSWLLLRILDDATEGDLATVTFEARSQVSGRTQILREISRFERLDGAWYYVEGLVS